MTVALEKLVRMAEQITANMAYTDDQTVVATRVADHLNRFWDPRMRTLIANYAESENNELSPTLLLAMEQVNRA